MCICDVCYVIHNGIVIVHAKIFNYDNTMSHCNYNQSLRLITPRACARVNLKVIGCVVVVIVVALVVVVVSTKITISRDMDSGGSRISRRGVPIYCF